MKATLTVLGSGMSMGVPLIGCDCRVCTSPDPRDKRLRPSILLQYNHRNVIIDTAPDFREQALREGLARVDAVLYTHAHADHILGLDDLRPISFHHPDGKIPLFAQEQTAQAIRMMFRYVFDADYKYGGLPQVEMHRIHGPIELFGAVFEPIPIMHGEAEIYGFRFGTAAYLSDFSRIPADSMHKLRGLDLVLLNALRHTPHPAHSTVENSLAIVEELKPKRAYFTHIFHDLLHAETEANLPLHVRMAWDGLRLEFEI
jgi:phosphoribosyl 1,2-cyclic phosphate phosphodiesterase